MSTYGVMMIGQGAYECLSQKKGVVVSGEVTYHMNNEIFSTWWNMTDWSDGFTSEEPCGLTDVVRTILVSVEVVDGPLGIEIRPVPSTVKPSDVQVA